MACVDHTNLYKSCVKTIRSRKKASGETLPNARLFPTNSECFKKLPFDVDVHFFHKLREIMENIARHKTLLVDHRRKYLGHINDVSSMSAEECVYMEQIIVKNLRTIEEKLSQLEEQIPSHSLQSLKKKSFVDIRVDCVNLSTLIGSLEESDARSKKVIPSDLEDCMAFVTILVRFNLQSLQSYFSELKENRNQKQSIKAKLLRFHRPASVKKISEANKNISGDKNATNGTVENTQTNYIEDIDTEQPFSEPIVNGVRSPKLSRHSDDISFDSNGAVAEDAKPVASTKTYEYSESVLEDILSTEEVQMLEQENAMMYNELQSTHEEVKNITKQVAELGRLQSVLMESVEEQATVADGILDTVLHATDNVQEGNEQIREAMRKDASFRVGIMIFLIVMSCTILFLDWYNP